MNMSLLLKYLFLPYRIWWKYIIIHHSANTDHDTLDWQNIRKYHMSYRIDGHIVSKNEWLRRKKVKDGKRFELPWRDIGYHFGVEKIKGQYEVLLGRPITEYGAHCKGHGMNKKALGVCFIGDYDKYKPSREMLQFTAKRLIIPLLKISGLEIECIKGHRDFADTNCPGRNFNLEDFKDLIKTLSL
ncbi:MAG TPA: N-acetylmuramoyl-L-alanine amidase [Thermoplasmata archaeon]|nr:N-acetylmuramoyl-L-alanine amidase [Thermoplasmata archaeon]